MKTHDMKLYKMVPKGWSPESSYLIARRVENNINPTGELKTLYVVEMRWTAGGFGEPGKLTKSMRGCEYTPNEIVGEPIEWIENEDGFQVGQMVSPFIGITAGNIEVAGHQDTILIDGVRQKEIKIRGYWVPSDLFEAV